jgi:hypothetical protein
VDGSPAGPTAVTPCLQISIRLVCGGRWCRSVIWRSLPRPLAACGVAVFGCCMVSRLAAEAVRLEPRHMRQVGRSRAPREARGMARLERDGQPAEHASRRRAIGSAGPVP